MLLVLRRRVVRGLVGVLDVQYKCASRRPSSSSGCYGKKLRGCPSRSAHPGSPPLRPLHKTSIPRSLPPSLPSTTHHHPSLPSTTITISPHGAALQACRARRALLGGHQTLPAN